MPLFFMIYRFSETKSPCACRAINPALQYSSDPIHKQLYVHVCTLVVMFGIWNLDFFHTLLPPICLHVSIREAIAMDYSVAFYPLVLTILIYGLIELNDRGCKHVICLWKPFHKCSVHFRKKWIYVLPLLMLLSPSICYPTQNSMDLLFPTQLYNIYEWRQGWYPVFLLGCNCRTLWQGPNRHYSCNSHCTPVLHCLFGCTFDRVFYKMLSKMFWSLSLEKTTSSAHIHECI